MISNVTRHDERTALLEAVAVLSGFDLCRIGRLPDGTKPDVLKGFPGSGAVFIGDAKDTERPNNKDTLSRLFNYMAWFKIISDRNAGSIFAICFGNENDAPEWAETVRSIAAKAGLKNYNLEFTELGPADFLVVVLPTKHAF